MDPNQNMEAYIQSLVAAEVAKGQTGNTGSTEQNTQQVTTAPIKINVGGQDLQFNDVNALQAGLNQFVGTIAQQQSSLQEQIAAHQATLSQKANVKGDDAPQWDMKNFVDEMTADPRKGINYALNHLLFDGKADDAAAELKTKFKETEIVKRTIAAEQFRNLHPEYPGGSQIASVVEKVRTDMNLPYDVNGLEAAYLMAINRGHLPNLPAQYAAQQQQAQFQQQQGGNPQYNVGQPQTNDRYVPQQFPPSTGPVDPRLWNGGGFANGLPGTGPANPYLQGPPSVQRGSQFNPGYSPVDPESLSTEQIEKIFAQANRGQGR